MYVLMFFIVIVSCWVFVNWGREFVSTVPSYIIDPMFCDVHKCFGPLSVYRITFGLVLFHILQSLVMIGVRRTSDCRAVIQNGFWLFKIAAVIGLIVAAFFIPVQFYTYYGWAALVCAVVFLFIQLVLLVDFAHSWSESWLAKYNDDPSNLIWFRLLMGSTALMYVVSIAAIIAMYVLFSTTADCSINAVFVTVALLTGIALSCLAIHPRVQERSPSSGLLQPAVVFLYMTYLIWSAIMSEPADSDQFRNCNTVLKSDGTLGTSTGAILVGQLSGALLVMVAVSYSALRTSSQHATLLGNATAQEAAPINAQSIDEVAAAAEGGEAPPASSDDGATAKADEPVGYNYAFFHLTFAMASMYICMLMTNWSIVSNNVEDGTLIAIDQSVASVWIKAASSWFVAVLFAWSLVAPVMFANRDFGA